MVVQTEQVPPHVDEERWQRDRACGGGGLGRAEGELAADFVQGADVRVDDEEAVVEVDVGALESGEFAPAGSGVGGADDQDCRPLADQHGCLERDA
nr:hypothetical protein [Lentzea tibetensis]